MNDLEEAVKILELFKSVAGREFWDGLTPIRSYNVAIRILRRLIIAHSLDETEKQPHDWTAEAADDTTAGDSKDR